MVMMNLFLGGKSTTHHESRVRDARCQACIEALALTDEARRDEGCFLVDGIGTLWFGYVKIAIENEHL